MKAKPRGLNLTSAAIVYDEHFAPDSLLPLESAVYRKVPDAKNISIKYPFDHRPGMVEVQGQTDSNKQYALRFLVEGRQVTHIETIIL
jgi:hypothetical protein